jgi:hypothetical protein
MDVPIELVLALLDLSALEEVPRETESTGKFPFSRDEPSAEPREVVSRKAASRGLTDREVS